MYFFNNRQLTQAGAYFDTLQTPAGCDSLVTLVLSVRQGQNVTVDTAIAQGQTYTLPGGGTTGVAGTYTDTLTSLVNGCDSVITTNLSVISTIDVLSIIDAFTLRPNPANDFLIVSTSVTVNQIAVYTTTGQQVLLLQNPQPVSVADYRVDIEKLAAATYLIEVKSNGTSARRRWIKM